MALEMDIWNRQPATSKTGKSYVGYTVVFSPGQSGRLTDADQKPPFYVRDYQRRLGKEWLKLDATTITSAKVEAAKIQATLEASGKGLRVKEAEAIAEGELLADVIAEYLDETEANKKWKTFLAYKRTLDLFSESCKRKFLKDVKRTDVQAFKTFLKKTELDFSGRTIFNHFANLMIFLSDVKHSVENDTIDWPNKPERDADAYTPEEIKALLENTDTDGRLLLNCFLNSGVRDGELAHMTYGDVDYAHSIWKVSAKENWNWTPKTKESLRSIPVGDWLTTKIRERQKTLTAKPSDFIFPTKDGKPNDGHLIRVVKRAAKQAKLECRVDNHKFRATAITMWLRDGSTVPDVMKWVGHKSPETILRYAASVNLQDREVHKKATKGFERFAGVGD